MTTSDNAGTWRTGRKNPRNVYRQLGEAASDHDQSLGYFADPLDAFTASVSVSAMLHLSRTPGGMDALRATLRADRDAPHPSTTFESYRAFMAGWDACRWTSPATADLDAAEAEDAWQRWTEEQTAADRAEREALGQAEADDKAAA